NEPAGKGQQAASGIDRAARQQDGAALRGNRRGHDLRIQIEHEPAARAHLLLAVIGRDRLDREPRPAKWTVRDGRRRQDRVVAHFPESKPAILDATMSDDRRGPLVIGALTVIAGDALFIAGGYVLHVPDMTFAASS